MAQKVWKKSLTGAYHKKKKQPNQDCLCSRRNKNWVALAVADGVSACAQAQAGAQIACNALVDYFLEQKEKCFSLSDRGVARQVMDKIIGALRQASPESDLDAYSSTLAGALLDLNLQYQEGQWIGWRMRVVSLGDCMVGLVRNGEFEIAAMPEHASDGVCTTTHMDAGVQMKVWEVSLDEAEAVLLCSDGAWKSMFCRTRLHRPLEEAMAQGQWETVADWVEKADTEDDRSILLLPLTEEE